MSLAHLDAELRAVLEQMPPMDLTANIPLARRLLLEQLAALSPAARVGVSIEDRRIPGPSGAPEVGLRLYRPTARSQPLPGLLWLHGGGFVVGHPTMDDGLCQRFAEEAGCLVVSVDWRLAPEDPYPAGLEDAYAALVWMDASAAELGLDGRIAVAGASAGGGLAAGLSLLARDRGGPRLMFQMPLYGCLDDRHISPSSQQITDPRLWNRAGSMKAWALYLQGIDRQRPPVYAAPLRTENLAGLPPSYLCVGDLDLLRDENLEYAARLAQSGVPVEFHLYPGAFHGFELLVPGAAISRRASAGYIAALARAFGSDG